MNPKTYTDKTVCLQELVGIRTACEVDTDYPFWLEDIEGVDVKKLSSIAGPSNLTGKDFGRQLINSAAREMMGNLQLLVNNGYRMNDIFGSVCSSCSFLPTYLADTGIKIKSIVNSPYQVLRISSLKILANVTGAKNIVIDDGVLPVVLEVDLTSGVIMPVKLNYTTKERTVSIYFQDDTVPGGAIVCSKNSSCGCSGSSANSSPINVTGLLGGVDNSTQYGFLPCVTIECSIDALICSMIRSLENTFGLALLYKIAEKYYANRELSERNNESVSFNGEPQEEQGRNYGRLYWTTMNGTKTNRGIKNLINDFLRTQKKDSCVICDSKIMTASVTG